MKTLKRTLCILLTLFMLFSAGPAEGLIPLCNKLTSLAAGGQSLEVDYNAASTGSLQDAKLADSSYQTRTVDENYYKTISDHFLWKHTSTIRGRTSESGTNDLRSLLESTVWVDQYICLTGDIDYQCRKDTFDPIVITKDKVLDLNGYSITMRDDSNMTNSGYNQSKGVRYHRNHLFEITNGATLIIVDSSRWRANKKGTEGDAAGTGYIACTGRMIYPFEHDIEVYTTRDLFWVTEGTLITYGGTYQAGRQKAQVKKNFSWSKLKNAIGQAVELGVNVASFATGIDMAVSAKDDLVAGFKNQAAVDNPDDDGLADTVTSTKKKNGSGAPAEALADSASGESSRAKTVGEKSDGAREGNGQGTAKKENTQMAQARKDVTESVLNQSTIGKITNGVFNLVDSIKDMIGTDYGSRVTEAILGTPVHLGTEGTFICYGGTFKGYGSTPNTRDAVVEVTMALYGNNDSLTVNQKTGKYLGGQAYIYGGTFEGYAGADIFHFVRADDSTQTTQQVTALDSGSRAINEIALSESETNKLRVLHNVDGVPISTRNVTVRGGTFRNYYELMMVSTKTNDDQHFTKFPGTPGGFGLGVESLGEDMIKDGRIQVVDKYGDGNLILLDETKEAGEKVYHHRLFCSDLELRYKQYIEVHPNDNDTNTTHSFKLVSVISDDKKGDTSTGWTSEDGNDRAAPLNQTETVFSYPLDSVATGTYYVMPELKAKNSSGEGIENSDIWYYPVPTTTDGGRPGASVYFDALMTGRTKDGNTEMITSQAQCDNKKWETRRAALDPSTVKYYAQNYNILSDVKWFTYRIYRVDPLTRNNISESAAYGSDVPLCELVFGVDTDTMQCRITLKRLEEHMKKTVSGFTGFKTGEMYRIVLNMEEHLSFDLHHYYNTGDRPLAGGYGTRLPVATATSSILFKCYSVNELKDLGGKVKDVDYTALQWETPPEPGKYAAVKIVNGMAGKTDYLARKIFDVYYQWYAVDSKGKETMIAGTDNIYTNCDDGKTQHTYEYWNVRTDGHQYCNTVDPNDANASKYTWHGLPEDSMQWSDEMIHAYTHQMTTTRGTLSIDTSQDPYPVNNRPYATGTDSCYIPESLAGQKIYCKVTVVNTYWPMEFDHVQVYYSHPVQLKDPPPQPVKSRIWYSATSSHYISESDPAVIRFTELSNLAKGETVTSVTYIANGRQKTFSGFNATKASEIPTAKYPQDFGLDVWQKINAHDVKVSAFITLSSGRGAVRGGASAAKGYTADKEIFFHYDVKATSIKLIGLHEINMLAGEPGEEYGEYLYAQYSPTSATYGCNRYAEGITFTTTDAEIATLNEKGKLVLGGKLGEATIAVISPDKKTDSAVIRVTDEVDEVYVFGIDAPEVGQPLDFTAEVPEDANYRITELYWVDVTNGSVQLDEGAVAEDYTYYKVHAEVETTSENVGFRREVPALMTVGAVGGGEITADETNENFSLRRFSYPDSREVKTVEMEYTYRSTIGSHIGAVINRVYIDFPTEVKEGSYVDDWLDQVEVSVDADVPVSDLGINKLPIHADGAANVLYPLGYPHVPERLNLFIKGVQSGLQLDAHLPTGVSFGPYVTFFINGVRTWLPYRLWGDIGYYNDSVISLYMKDVLTVADGKTPQPFTLSYRVRDFNLTVGGIGQDAIVRLNSLREGPDAPMVRLRAGEPHVIDPGDSTSPEPVTVVMSTDLIGRDEYAFDAHEAVEEVYLPIWGDVDMDGDRHTDFTFNHGVYKKIYDTAVPPAPEALNTNAVSVKVLNTDGTLFNTQTYYVGDRFLIGELILPENVMIRRIYNSKKEEYAISDNGKVTFPNDDTASVITVETVAASPGVFGAGKTDLTVLSPLPNVLYSLDGEHWQRTTRFTDLKPNSNYVLYYRQTMLGEVYATAFHTAGSDYGVWVGETPVTDLNRDLMPVNHWKYDPDTNTLTIENMDLYTFAVERAAIYANHDLTVELLGENLIDGSVDEYNCVGIRVNGDLTLKGTGNLHLTALNTAIELCQNLYLEHTGQIRIDHTDYGVYFTAFEIGEDSLCEIKNGAVQFTSFVSPGAAGTNAGALFNRADEISFEHMYNAAHREHLELTGDSEAAFIAAATKKGNAQYFTRHYGAHTEPDTREFIISSEYPYCTAEHSYYMRCECGAVDTGGRHVAAAEASHDLISVPDKAPTCYTPGWKDYKYCSRCRYSRITPLPATGHTWNTHTGVAPTCTSPGTPTWSECTACGISTLASAVENGGENTWEPRAHNIIRYAGAAATCSRAGIQQHYICTLCRTRFTDEAGLQSVTEAEMTIPATEHVYGEWTVTEEPTATSAGSAMRICTVCGEEQTVTLDQSGSTAMPGDVDFDTKITASDARLCLRRAVDLETYPEGSKEFIACDVDKDGKVTASDARMILRAAVDLEDPKTW